MMHFGRFAGLGAMAAVLACGSDSRTDSGGTSNATETGGAASVTVTTGATGSSATIGAGGGAIVSPTGAGVRIPPGALPGDVQIQVLPSALVPPPEMKPLSQAYDFLPADLSVAVPVTLELPLPEGTTAAVVFQSRADGSGWDLVGGASWGGSIKVDVTRFGAAFAAAPR